MLKTFKNGFTVVELMIVLAISGFILSMIFFIIPTATRWSNNNTRKADVSTILQSVSDFRLQHMGGLPDTLSLQNVVNNKLKIYETTNINSATASAPVDFSRINTDTVSVYNNAKCPTDGTTNTLPAGSRDVVALYALDGGQGNTVPLCKEL